jgi:hypothetical protein
LAEEKDLVLKKSVQRFLDFNAHDATFFACHADERKHGIERISEEGLHAKLTRGISREEERFAILCPARAISKHLPKGMHIEHELSAGWYGRLARSDAWSRDDIRLAMV